MGKPITDLMLSGFFEYCIHDLRNNLWLLKDIYGDSVMDPLTKVQHGDKEPRNALDWFINNNIAVVLHLRRDRPTFPCISVALSNSQEMISKTTLGDQHPLALGDIDPSEFDVHIDRVYDNFTPTAYDPLTGIVTMPSHLDTYQISAGMHILVEDKTGKAYQIKKCIDDKSFMIAPNTAINLKDVYIVPIDTAWVVYRERTAMQETYEIGCHTSSDPIEAIWLSQLVEYCLLKYKSKFLDERNLQLSTFSCSNVSKNENYTGDTVFSRYFSLNFHSEMDWIREVAPKISRVQGGIIIIDGPKTPAELSEYIKKQYVRMEGDK